MKHLFILLAITISSSVSSKGWTDLFNGKNFKGFTQLNGQAPFTVENGEMVGTSTTGQPNSFMATDKLYGDFILEFDVKCNPDLNSGVQFRSLSVPEYNKGRVHGYQCEIDPSDRAWSGGIYDEARRGWLVTLTDNKAGQKAYKRDDWNHYRIEALGEIIRIWVNGVNTSNLLDNETLNGFIAFQVHSSGEANKGKQIRWKNIRIKTKISANDLLKGDLAPEINRVPNTISGVEQAAGWRFLFDGKSTAGWRSSRKETFPDKGWTVADGALTVNADGTAQHGGDIITEEKFDAFELSFEFKITKGANSGLKYFVVNGFGPEYQILDDANHGDANQFTSIEGSRRCGGLYDLIKPTNVRFNGIGQWNHGVIKAFPNNHIEHWLNGFKTVEYERGSEAFRELVKNSKFVGKEYNVSVPYGEIPEGNILLQDHNDNVSFRNIKIRKLSR
ncbi:MAG: DUF1080 domain-containing protein [Tannerella sp.]|jgi:hypothetical protein|nr:DUF1080 domain-containing protein [Tannerella sp.]